MAGAAARHAPRVWLPSASLAPGAAVALPPRAVAHLGRALRAAPGARLTVFNARDGEFAATLSASRRGVADVAARVRAPPPAGAPAAAPTLLLPLLSGAGALAALVDGATALGAGAFLTLEADRAQARWAPPPGERAAAAAAGADDADDDGGAGGDGDGDGGPGAGAGGALPAAVAAVLAAAALPPAPAARPRAAARLHRVAVSAAEQCGALHVPLLHAAPGLTLARWLAAEAAVAAGAGAGGAAAGRTLTLVLDNVAPWPRVRDALAAAAAREARAGAGAGAPRRHVVLAVGPEGGWSPPEAAALAAARAGASLGPRALRAELAAAAALVDAAAW